MEPVNGYIQIKKMESDKIAWDEGNEYEVVEMNNTPSLMKPSAGDKVIVESDRVIKVNVNNQDVLFVHEDSILARISKSRTDYPSDAPTRGDLGTDLPDFSPR